MKDASKGFGGKYGVQRDRMDKTAEGHDFIGKTEAHSSQKDYSSGKRHGVCVCLCVCLCVCFFCIYLFVCTGQCSDCRELLSLRLTQ